MGLYASCCIIDDDELFSFRTKELIKDVNFCENVLTYSDGQNAIDGLIGLMVEGVTLPNLIFLDIQMPRRDGWSFLEEFVKLPSNVTNSVSIYITSSFADPEMLAKAKEYKVIKDFLVKPLTKEILLTIKKN